MPGFEHNGTRLNYELMGNWDAGRLPILLLHGNGESMRVFDDSISQLMDECAFIGLDSRAQGLSSGEPAGYRVMADDALALLRYLGVNRCNIVGFSDGAIIAIMLAMDNDIFDRAVLIGANIDPKGLKPFVRLEMQIMKAFYKIKRDDRSARLFDLMLKEPNISLKSLKSINARTYVVVGSNDMIKRAHTLSIHEAITGSELLVFDGVGHMIPQEAPARLSELLKSVFMVK